MTPLILSMLILGGLLSLLAGPGLLLLAKRRNDAIKRGIVWQVEKQRRFQAGWRPTLWEPDATDEEKEAVLMAYLQGKPLPKQSLTGAPLCRKRRSFEEKF